MTDPKKLLVPVLATLLASSAFAATQAQNRSNTNTTTPRTNTQTQQAPQQRGDRPAPRGPLTVKYYAGNPLEGGKVLSTATIQPPAQNATTPTNPFANAPKGTTHVAISDGFGTRILTLQDAQAQPFGDRDGFGRGRGGPGGSGGRGDRGAPPARQNQSGSHDQPGTSQNGRVNRDDANGLRLPGLRDASSVTFYAANPLTGGQALTTVKLSNPVTTQQQQALTQAAAKAKFAVIQRGNGDTMIVDLSAQPTAPR
ncbi:hypothetical protein [Deinococcus yavapaiensis]|uniref:Uncharacterized protein n=1 Tax=Deinococcus yavapaiensis KR-236 TaxID=694435 RepID=A0A318SAZ0_9DEIO|nr:hypothetical protein [Deinococcus yavapaiensis]PYE53779.1 hypothetical protein DES52_10737 [Deinococcus yavapaiensis KR-236]